MASPQKRNGIELTEKQRKRCSGENRYSDGIMYGDCTTDSIKLSPSALISVIFCLYFQHAHLIPIVGGEKRDAY